jgi:hydroxymethylpyrimidine pyrophosphatase-like HAD family hydrolase
MAQEEMVEHNRGMVISDLDGTLLDRERRVSERDLFTLRSLGRRGVVRVIATGRSLYSANRVLPPEFPIDYLVFSSGAGTLEWPGRRLLCTHTMGRREIRHVFRVLSERKLDFMVHRPIPDNHHFTYFQPGESNPDFRTRVRLYRQFATEGDPQAFDWEAACQFLAVVPATAPGPVSDELRRTLLSQQVIRTTSPLDHSSVWIEIFPPQVSKSQAGAWLAKRLDIRRSSVMAVGNDYNDSDLLDWAGSGYVVANAPGELRQKFPTVASHQGSGFSEAVERWGLF